MEKLKQEERIGKYKMPRKSLINLNLKRKLLIGTVLGGILSCLFGALYLTDMIARWGAENEIVYHAPISVSFAYPVEIKPREKVVQVDSVVYQVIEITEVNPEFYKDLTETEKKICDAFGLHCKEAIAIAKAESGMRVDAMNINTNNTIDLGLFQINSVHYKKQGCSLQEIVTVEGNIKCAKQIYDASGWNAWVAYNKGVYLKFLK